MTRLEIGAERWRRIEDILDVALAHDPADWATLLDERCEGDPLLRAEVESLLRQSDRVAGFLTEPPAAAAAAAVQQFGAPTATPPVEGRRIGAYRLVREIGRGGMARVFLAERVEGGFVHRVALKLLRPGLDTEVDLARFRAERQILASLNHPNVARLLALCVISRRSPVPANNAVWSPTMSPPRTVANPMVLDWRSPVTP